MRRLFFKMKVCFKSIALYLYKKGLSGKDIKEEIDEVFPDNKYSHQQITYFIRSLSWTAINMDSKQKDLSVVKKQRINLIKKTLKDYPFSSTGQIARRTNIPKTTIYRILSCDLGIYSKEFKICSTFFEFFTKSFPDREIKTAFINSPRGRKS